MKLKKCSCSSCKYGLRTKCQSYRVRRIVQNARRKVKQNIKTDYIDIDELTDSLDSLDVFVNVGYTD